MPALPLPQDATHAIQEANLKAALDTLTIYVETMDADGNSIVEAVEREVRACPSVLLCVLCYERAGLQGVLWALQTPYMRACAHSC